jgi:hypothetical protein
MFEENIGDSINEDEQTFEPLHGEGATPFSIWRTCRRFEIPRPAKPRKAANAAEQVDDAEEEENAAFDEVG